MNIYGRKEEIKVLQNAFDSDKPELIPVYGRRRIGKTWLINEFFSSQDCIYFKTTGSIQERSIKTQLFNFLTDIKRVFGLQDSEKISDIKSWSEAFALLALKISLVSKHKKIVLFFDELPWFDTPRSNFINSFGHFWNHHAESTNYGHLKVVVCGSSTSWMIKNIISEKGSFFQRKTRNIPLEPFSLKDTKGYLKFRSIELTNKSILEIYLTIGGVAKYLDKVVSGKTSAELIDDLFFSKDGEFRKEFYSLYSATFQNHVLHVQISKLLSNSLSGLTRKEIIEKSKKQLKSGNALTQALSELVAASFVKQTNVLSLDSRVAGKNEIKYKLIDEYSLFYFKWLENVNIDFDSGGVKHYWHTVVNSNTYNNWVGHAFEAVCHKHIGQIKNKLDIVDNVSPYWWKTLAEDGRSGAEIDLLIQRLGKDKSINICELKFYNGPYSLTLKSYENIKNKIAAFKSKNKFKDNIFVTLITAEGAVKNKYYNEIIHNQVCLDELFD